MHSGLSFAAILIIVAKFTDEQYTLLINQLQDISTRGSLIIAYKLTRKQLTTTLGSKRESHYYISTQL